MAKKGGRPPAWYTFLISDNMTCYACGTHLGSDTNKSRAANSHYGKHGCQTFRSEDPNFLLELIADMPHYVQKEVKKRMPPFNDSSAVESSDQWDNENPFLEIEPSSGVSMGNSSSEVQQTMQIIRVNPTAWHKAMYFLGTMHLAQGQPFRNIEHPYLWKALAVLGVVPEHLLKDKCLDLEKDAVDYARGRVSKRDIICIPSRKTVSGPILEHNARSAKSAVREACKKAPALALSTDGWTDNSNRTVLNFIVLTPKPFFWKATYPGGTSVTAEYIAGAALGVMDEIAEECGFKREDKFRGIITDNCATMRKFWRLVRQQLPSVWTVGCSAHVTSLLVKDIVQLVQPIAELLKISSDIVSTVNKSSLLEGRLTEQGARSMKFQRAVETRWGTQYTTMRSVLRNMEGVRQAIAASREIASGFSEHLRGFIISHTSEDRLRDCCKFLKEFSVVIHALESDSCVLSDVFIFYEHLQHNAMSDRFLSACGADVPQQVASAVLKRWREFLNHDVVLAAFTLDPRYTAFARKPCVEALERVMLTFFGRGPALEAAYQQFETFLNLPTNDMSIAFNRRHPCLFWGKMMELKMPELTAFAQAIFCIPAASAGCERNFSDYGFIVSTLRNRMSQDTAPAAVASFGYHKMRMAQQGTGDSRRAQLSEAYNALWKRILEQYDKRVLVDVQKGLEQLCKDLGVPSSNEQRLGASWEAEHASLQEVSQTIEEWQDDSDPDIDPAFPQASSSSSSSSSSAAASSVSHARGVPGERAESGPLPPAPFEDEDDPPLTGHPHQLFQSGRKRQRL